ncbi:MAG: hypothetical protein RL186_29 [Pseudomonadota bacterium]|jgi:serine/threonine protein phosphatase 1
MFSWLKPTSKSKSKSSDAAYIPDGQIVYAIGDLHGTIDLTHAMIARLLDDAKAFAPAHPHLVFLGDYVDKGDHSKDVVDALIALQRREDVTCTCIKGNHEDALLTFLDNPLFGPQWLAYGGGPTLQSYGVSLPVARATEELWQEMAGRFQAALPPEHLAFFQALPTSLFMGGYFFAHAGIRPGRALDEQEDGDLMWIRRQFLDDRRNLPAVIVHGHSPDLEPYQDHRRIGIDTGAYATGRLSAVRLFGAARDIICVSRDDA